MIAPGKTPAGVPLLSFIENTDGATAVEYGLLAGLVAVGLAGGLGALADLVNMVFDLVADTTTQVAADMPAD